ncbi:insulinase family protein [Clostridiaceae bacterium M8S5]|nr:insulinase family protein [Clostridiaceae bacterium M8S5]
MSQEIKKSYIEISREFVRDIDSEVIHLKHIKSKAQVIFLKNNHPHLALNIAFRTSAFDDSGIAHILEHCIYSGSDSYPSLNILSKINNETFCTYINGVTSVDKTMYQYSTFSENDFWNITELYFNVLFKPLVLNDKSIFKLEGNSTSEGRKTGGIVYREMLNIFSSDKQILFREIYKKLFVGSQYQFSTAGIPSKILEANYDDLKKYHREYYVLSNCYLYVYGNINEIKLMKKFDELFELYSYSYSNNLNMIYEEIEHRKKDVYILSDYSAYHNNIKKEYFSINWIVGSVKNPDDYYLYEVLRRALLIHNNNELERRIKSIDSRYQLNSYFNNGLYQYPFGLIVSCEEIKNIEEIEIVIREFLRDLVSNHFDDNTLNEIIDYIEYASATGVYRGIKFNQKYSSRVFESVIYGGKPEAYLKTSEIFRRIRELVKRGEILKTSMKILNSSSSIVVLKKENRTGSDSRNIHYANSKKVQVNNVKSKSLIDYKSITEVLNSIHKESLFKICKYNIDKVQVLNLRNNNPDNIVKITLFFRKKIDNIKKTQSLKLILKQFGLNGTKTKSSSEFKNLMQKYLYDYSCGIEASYDNSDEVCIYFSFSCFKNVLNNAFELLYEILYDSIVIEESMKNSLINEYHKMYRKINYKSFYVTKLRAKSKFSEFDFKNENINGMSYFLFLLKLLNNEKSEKNTLDIAKELKNEVFCKCNANFIVSTQNRMDKMVEISLRKFVSNLHTNVVHTVSNKIKRIHGNDIYKKEAFIFSNKLSSLSQSIKLMNIDNRFGYEASELLIRQYCDDVLKSQGVYSSYTEVDKSGIMTVTSFRDPKVDNSLSLFKGLVEYFSKAELTETMKAEITRYIISKKYIRMLKMDEISLLRNYLSDEKNMFDGYIKVDLDKNYLNSISESIMEAAKAQSICYVGDEHSLNNTKVYETVIKMKE